MQVLKNLCFKILFVTIVISKIVARIAQLVEQWIEDPRVTSSNLVLGIFFKIFYKQPKSKDKNFIIIQLNKAKAIFYFLTNYFLYLRIECRLD